MGKRIRREILVQGKVWETQEYWMYFKVFKLRDCAKRSAEGRSPVLQSFRPLNQALFPAEILEKGIIFLKEAGRVQMIGTVGGALAAVDAVFHGLHLFPPLGGGVALPGGAPQHETHPGQVVDGDPRGAGGHTVAAAPAEIPLELPLVLFDDGAELAVQRDPLLRIGEEVPQLAFLLDAPDGDHIVILGEEGIGRPGAGQQPAAHPLHGDEAHVVFLTDPDELQILVGGQVAQGKLDGVEQAAFGGGDGHIPPVGGDADEPGLARGPGLQQRLIGPLGILRVGEGGDVVELPDVHMVGLHVPQRGLQLVQRPLAGAVHGLGGQDDLVPDGGEAKADLFLAVAVGPGGVKEIDARVKGLSQEGGPLFGAHPLDGERPKAVFGDLQAGAAQALVLHIHRSFSVFSKNMRFLQKKEWEEPLTRRLPPCGRG